MPVYYICMRANFLESCMKNHSIRKIAYIGVLSALAAVAMVIKFPVPWAPTFYKMEFSEVICLIGGFILGAPAAIAIEFVKIMVNFLLDGTTTAGIGEISNFLMGCSFVVPATIIFRRKRTIQSAIAGVAVAFCVPATLSNGSRYYLHRIKAHVARFPEIDIDDKDNTIVWTNEEIHVLKSIESAADKMISPLQYLEDSLHFPINYIVIPLFAFANAGVCFEGMSLGSVFSGVGLAVMLGLVLGKFIGVFSFSWLAVRFNIVRLPEKATWKSFAGVCMLCGIGFTVSMFIADLSYSGVEGGAAVLDQAKLGILISSVIAAIIGCVMLNRTLPPAQGK